MEIGVLELVVIVIGLVFIVAVAVGIAFAVSLPFAAWRSRHQRKSAKGAAVSGS